MSEISVLSHHLRQTGRTTRMLAHAIQQLVASPQKQIIVLCRSQQDTRALSDMVEKLLETNHQSRKWIAKFEFQVAPPQAPVNQKTRVKKTNPDVIEYTDHAVFELWYEDMLADLHRWDEMIRL